MYIFNSNENILITNIEIFLWVDYSISYFCMDDFHEYMVDFKVYICLFEAIDPALLKCGRFDQKIRIGIPNKKGRKEILQIHMKEMPLATDVSLDDIAEITDGYVGADLLSLCKEAAMCSLRKVLPEINPKDKRIPKEVLEDIVICKEDFEQALETVEPYVRGNLYHLVNAKQKLLEVKQGFQVNGLTNQVSEIDNLISEIDEIIKD